MHQLTKTPSAWIKAIKAKDVAALSQAITLIESTTKHDQSLMMELFHELANLPPRPCPTLRLGITGPPGVGKSTLTDLLGMWWINQGHRVAVLAVDPSSSISGGSLLVDKTRMPKLSAHPQAYVRPSPSGHGAIGVHPQARAAISLFEVADYDVIIVESVGVGQLEMELALMVDHLTLVQIPGAGDEWQAMKKGLIEHVDLFCIHKADHPNDPKVLAAISAMHHVATITDAETAHTTRRPIMAVSSLTGHNTELLARTITEHWQDQHTSGRLQKRRHRQAQAWFRQECLRLVHGALTDHPAFKAALNQFDADLHPLISAYQASQHLCHQLLQPS